MTFLWMQKEGEFEQGAQTMFGEVNAGCDGF